MHTSTRFGLFTALGVALLCGRAASQAPASLLRPPTLVVHSGEPAVVGDVDGDGHLDLLAYQDEFTPVAFQVHRGDGLGGFAPPVDTIIAPVEALDPAGGDFDEDGRTDVAFMISGTASVGVLRGASDGSLVGLVTLPLPNPGLISEITLCDATGDGHLDIVAAQSGTNRLALFAGTGDGGFVDPPGQVIANANTFFLTSGDFDGDGDADLITSAGSFNNLTSVLWGHGDGTFDPSVQLPGIQTTPSRTVGDLNGDGRDDLVQVTGLFIYPNSYLSWQPGPGFTATPILSGHVSSTAAVGDLDRDGVGELILSGSTGIVEVYQRQLDGTLMVSASYATAEEPRSLSVGDLDADGALDVVASGSVATRFAGQGNGELYGEYSLEAYARDLAAADLTGDGFPDVVAVFGLGHPAQMLRGRMDGGLGPAEPIDAGPAPTQLWLVDATGDGVLDLLTAGGSAVTVVAGQGNGNFDPPAISPTSAPIVQARLGDFGGDELPDLATLLSETSSSTSRHVTFLVNDRGSYFEAGSTSVTPPGGESKQFQVADLDEDLDLDLLVRWEGGYMRVFMNNPAGFEPALFESMPGSFLGVGDYDADGHMDFARTSDDGFGFDLRYGDGTGGFSAPSVFGAFLQSFYALRSVDLDRDGIPDLVAVGEGGWGDQFEISVALGLGGRNFAPIASWTAGDNALRLAPADLNGDGATDLAVSLDSGQLLTIENGTGPWAPRGHSLAGAVGFSRLQGFGPLTPGSPVTLRVGFGQPFAPAFLIAGATEILVPFKGGVLVPQPTLIIPLGALDATGGKQVSGTWPAGMPAGAGFSMQVWRPETGAPSGFGATTAIRGTAP